MKIVNKEKFFPVITILQYMVWLPGDIKKGYAGDLFISI